MDSQKMNCADESFISDDVRMRGFKQRSTVEQLTHWIDQQSVDLAEENIAIQDATGRVLSQDIASDINIPGFARSMMDGYALIASDTHGASSYNRLPLQIIGQSMPGHGSNIKVISGTAVKIMTGAPVPEGANAILPAENVELDEPFIMVMESVAEGRNIGRVGEDISADAVILKQNRCLRPQDIALLASIGNKDVVVKRRVKASIVVTGNEILPVGNRPQRYQITNSNGPMLEALSRRDNAVIINSSIVPDDPRKIEQAMLADYDILLMTGGTSVGEEDLVPLLVAKLGTLVFHGVTMRPSRSTGIGVIDNRLVFLLPGNPVACLCAYDFFAGRYLRRVSAQPRNWPYFSVQKRLKQKITSMLGRTDYARIRLAEDHTVEPIAISGAAIMSSTTEADGFVIIPANSEGYAAGTDVEVFLYD